MDDEVVYFVDFLINSFLFRRKMIYPHYKVTFAVNNFPCWGVDFRARMRQMNKHFPIVHTFQIMRRHWREVFSVPGPSQVITRWQWMRRYQYHRGISKRDMDDCSKVLRGWSWEENKLFELALAVVDNQCPDRWEVIAAMIGGNKNAGDVQEHYETLLEDLHLIESGKLDHKLPQTQPCLLLEFTHSLCLSD